jgi:hypothetical protein
VNEDYAKEFLHKGLQWTREALLWKVEGLSEYDVRRPLTVSGTSLLGLVKHMASVEARYFGEVFGRPSPESLVPWQESDGGDLWVTADESRDDIIGFYRRAWEYADATIAALPLGAPGLVPWWTNPETTLFGVLVHVREESARHTGHADILREGLDGSTGSSARFAQPVDEEARTAYWSKLEGIARTVGSGADGSGS